VGFCRPERNLLLCLLLSATATTRCSQASLRCCLMLVVPRMQLANCRQTHTLPLCVVCVVTVVLAFTLSAHSRLT
jgi:hypothetical protein